MSLRAPVRSSSEARYADAMLERGNMEGAEVWRRVIKAAKELQRAQPILGEAIH